MQLLHVMSTATPPKFAIEPLGDRDDGSFADFLEEQGETEARTAATPATLLPLSLQLSISMPEATLQNAAGTTGKALPSSSTPISTATLAGGSIDTIALPGDPSTRQHDLLVPDAPAGPPSGSLLKPAFLNDPPGTGLSALHTPLVPQRPDLWGRTEAATEQAQGSLNFARRSNQTASPISPGVQGSHLPWSLGSAPVTLAIGKGGQQAASANICADPLAMEAAGALPSKSDPKQPVTPRAPLAFAANSAVNSAEERAFSLANVNSAGSLESPTARGSGAELRFAFQSLPIAGQPTTIVGDMPPTLGATASEMEPSPDAGALIDRLMQARLGTNELRSAVELQHPDFGEVTIDLKLDAEKGIELALPRAAAELRALIAQALDPDLEQERDTRRSPLDEGPQDVSSRPSDDRNARHDSSETDRSRRDQSRHPAYSRLQPEVTPPSGGSERRNDDAIYA